MEPVVDEINTLTTKHILRDITDNYFKGGPFMQWFKRNRYVTFPGGSLIQAGFLYKGSKGGAYKKGGKFDITSRRTRAALQFQPKYYEQNVTESLEEIEVELRGEHAVVSKVRNDLAIAALTISAQLEVAMWRHGQALAGDDRSAEINGIEEALNDGLTASFGGNLFATYGGEARATVAPALTPAGGTFAGGPTPVVSANTGGPINYRVLEHSYQSCVIDDEHPVMGVTSNRVMGFLGENFHPLQRIDQKEPTIGYTGLKFKDATIVQSQYIPSQDGINDADLGNYSATSELFAWINPGPEGEDAYMQLHVSASPKYQFGFTGFKQEADSTMVAGQILVALNALWRSVRLMRLHHGITTG